MDIAGLDIEGLNCGVDIAGLDIEGQRIIIYKVIVYLMSYGELHIRHIYF